VIYLIQSDVN